MTNGKNSVDSLKVMAFTGANLRITANGNDNFFYLTDNQIQSLMTELDIYLAMKKGALRKTLHVTRTALEAFDQGEKLESDTVERIANYYKFVAKYGLEAADILVIDEEQEDEDLKAYMNEYRYNHEEIDINGNEIDRR